LFTLKIRVLRTCKNIFYVSNFEHVNFAISGKYSQKIYNNPNYHASPMIFQTYKHIILKKVHSLGWLLWLCFYPWILLINQHPLENIWYAEKDCHFTFCKKLIHITKFEKNFCVPFCFLSCNQTKETYIKIQTMNNITMI
jgi:hypothetical protein